MRTGYNIRAATSDDRGQIAAMFLRTFRSRADTANPALANDLNQLLLEHPDATESSRSLVAVANDGEISAFLGILPIPLAGPDDVSIACAVSCWMVANPESDPLSGALLLRTQLKRTNTLTFTDTGNSRTLEFQRSLKMRFAPAHSLSWWRPLNLSGAAASRLFARRAGPFTRLAAGTESMLRSLVLKREQLAFAGWRSRDASPSEYAQAWIDCAAELSVRPAWSSERLQWMVAFAGRRAAFGPLRLQIVCDPAGKRVGCYAYHAGAGREGVVISILTRRGSEEGVARLLLDDAVEQHCVSLQGPANPRTIEGFHGIPHVYYRNAAATIISGGASAMASQVLIGEGLIGGWVGDSWTPLSTEQYA